VQGGVNSCHGFVGEGTLPDLNPFIAGLLQARACNLAPVYASFMEIKIIIAESLKL
jgi:hypothetical protein